MTLRRIIACGLLLAGCFFSVSETEVYAQQTNNYELRTIPAPKKVVLDGKLNEWDLSGEIFMCYDVEKLSKTHSVRVAAMYNQDGFYLSFRFKDATPMVNRVDPALTPGNGWCSDAVQLRIWTDPNKPLGPPAGGRITHIDCYWFSDKGVPAAHVVFGDLSHGGIREGKIPRAIGKGIDVAFLKDADGKGYTQEMRIDWKLLRRDGSPYKAGQSFRMGIEAFWGDATAREYPAHRLVDLVNKEYPQREFFWVNHKAWGKVRFLDHGNLKTAKSVTLLSKIDELRRLRYSTEGPVEIKYTLPADGYATLVIEDANGKRIRNLISNYPRKGGENVDYWDGADDQGNLVSPGAYRVRGLYHGELDALYEFSYGSPGNPPWPTGDTKGDWLANHTPPLDILADDKRVYVSSAHAEGPHALMALDAKGNKVWGGLARWYGGVMARAGKYLYVLNDRGASPARSEADLKKKSPLELIRIDPATGEMVNFPDGESRHVIATWNVQKEGASLDDDGTTFEKHEYNADWLAIQAQGLAALNGKLYGSLHFRDSLLVIDANTGMVVGTIAIKRPAGLVANQSTLYAISETSVLRIDPETKKITPVITTGLKAPISLALDAQGHIYVADWADQMCVKVFSPAGKLIRTVGKMGGRAPLGAYDPEGMLLPRGISIDNRGRLWVAEMGPSPRRISCWNSAGTLALEKPGGAYYAAYGTYVFPAQPELAFSQGNSLDLDWKKGRWRIKGTPWRATRAGDLLGLDEKSEISAVRVLNGRRFIVHSANHGTPGGATVISEWKNGRAIPLAAVGACVDALRMVNAELKGGLRQDPIFIDHLWTDARINKAARQTLPWIFSGPMAGNPQAFYSYANIPKIRAKLKGWKQPVVSIPNGNFVWSDLDGDGQVDAAEVQYYATPGLPGNTTVSWRPDQWSHGVSDKDLSLYFTALSGGKSYHYKLPISGWAKSGAPLYKISGTQKIVASRFIGDVSWVSQKGNILTVGHRKTRARGGCTDPLVMFRPDGSIAWTYPNDYGNVAGSHTAPMAKNGLLLGTLGVMGRARLAKVGEIFAFHTNMGQAVFFTEDGLFISELFRDSRSGAESYPKKIRRGMSLKETSNGGEWFGGQMFQTAKTGQIYITAVRSMPCITKITGLDSVSRLPESSLTFTKEHYQAAEKLMLARQTANADGARVAIKHLNRLAATPPPEKAFSWTANNSVSWLFDENHSAKATWMFDKKNLHVCFQNVQDDTPMINGGEDPQRLFKFGDAVLLELRTQPNVTSKNVLPGDLRLLFSVHNGKPIAVLYRYLSPEAKSSVKFVSVATTKIDVITVLANAKVVIDRSATGYSLRASIPLNELDFHPEVGKTYQGDFGIIYSDKIGQKDVLRMNWANKATGLTDDLSGEAKIQPGYWGEFAIGAKK